MLTKAKKKKLLVLGGVAAGVGVGLALLGRRTLAAEDAAISEFDSLRAIAAQRTLKLNDAVDEMVRKRLVLDAAPLRQAITRGVVKNPIEVMTAFDILANKEAKATVRAMAVEDARVSGHNVSTDVRIGEDVKLLAMKLGLPVWDVAARWAHWHNFTVNGRQVIRWHAHTVKPTLTQAIIKIGGGLGTRAEYQRAQRGAAQLEEALRTGGPPGGSTSFRNLLAMHLPHGKAGMSSQLIMSNFERGVVLDPPFPRRRRKEPGFFGELAEVGNSLVRGDFRKAWHGLDDPFAAAWRDGNRLLKSAIGVDLEWVDDIVGDAFNFVVDNIGTIALVLAAVVLVATGAGAPVALALLGAAYGPIMTAVVAASLAANALKAAVATYDVVDQGVGALDDLAHGRADWRDAGALLDVGGAVASYVPGGEIVATNAQRLKNVTEFMERV